jgi:hypothetical protein
LGYDDETEDEGDPTPVEDDAATLSKDARRRQNFDARFKTADQSREQVLGESTLVLSPHLC